MAPTTSCGCKLMLKRLFGAVQREVALRRDPIAWARGLGVHVGERCRLLGVSAATFGSEPYLITLGDHVTVTGDVRFVTHDGAIWVFRDELPDADLVAPIQIGNNVFIGSGALLLPGTVVGDNCIIAARAVVKGTVPPNTVVGGVPARRLMQTSEYLEKNVGQVIPTKGMNEAQKRSHLTAIFGNESKAQAR